MNFSPNHSEDFGDKEGLQTNPLRGAVQPKFIRDEILAEIFADTVAKHPKKIAMIEDERSITYAEVDKQSNAIARGLVKHGVGPGDVVGLYLARGIDLLVAQISIAKSGAAWLPFDSETPRDRIAVCLTDAKAKGLLTSADFAPRVQALAVAVWPISGAIQKAGRSKLVDARARGASAKNIAYMIYTSGSTGVPKGIAITNRNICHYLRASNSMFGISSADVMFQSCSVAFDLSMEEIWIPLMVGATLWVANGETLTDTEALPARMRKAGITAIDTVPTLLSLLVGDVPSLRTVIVGGEACPPSLVERFAHGGRRLFNSYGPTETTVVATMAELKPGDDVTIGGPIPNHSAYIVDEHMKLVAPGTKGELLIGGPGVAHGYVGQPDLTAQKFIANPFEVSKLDPILYRSGDSVSIDQKGRILFHGRIDDQVKIRGFRVELGEIETAIAAHEGVEHAAVVLRRDSDLDSLVAFVAARIDATVDMGALKTELRKRLPPYMVPARFELIDVVPRLSSGKVDRKTLKLLPLAKADDGHIGQEEPHNPVEGVLLHAARKVFPGSAIPLNADFFTELGGHSLIAAQFISVVRKTRGCAAITLQDVYEARTITAMAALLESRGGHAEEDTASNTGINHRVRSTTKRRILCGLAQAIALPFILALQTAPWLSIFIAYSLFSPDDASFLFDVAIVFAAFILVTIAEYMIVPAAKWLIIGRTKPGVYPLWGSYYYRVWLVNSILSMAHLKLMQGTPLIRIYLRLMGAKIGHDVLIKDIVINCIDLLTIGDHSSIGGRAIIANTRAEGDKFIIGPVTIGKDVVIGSSAIIENDVTIGDGVELSDLTSLEAGQNIPAFEEWGGSPAQKMRDLDPAAIPAAAATTRGHKRTQILLYGLMLLVLPTIGILPIVPSFRLMEFFYAALDPWLGGIGGDLGYLYFMPLLAMPAAACMVVISVLFIVAIRWLFLPTKMKAGTYSIYSSLYVRKWIVSFAVEAMLDTLSSIFASIYMRGFYRMMGAQIGPGSEVSTGFSGRFDLVEIGEGNFIADDVRLGDEEIRRNWMTLGRVTTGNRVFIGNSAVVPIDYVVESDALIGVKSRPPAEGPVNRAETWFGSPSIKFPVRQNVASNSDSTFTPPKRIMVIRALFEAFNICFPTALFITLATLGLELLSDPVDEGNWWEVALLIVLQVFVIDMIEMLIAVGFKWLLVGKYRPTVRPMWSWWAIRTEGVAGMFWSLTRRSLLEGLCGTPFLPMVLRLFGMKIGKGVFMNTTDICEFDCMRIGDFSVLNTGACLQTHLYEDRMMKIGNIWIGNDVTIGSGSTILYDTHIGDGAVIGPLTLVMKGEELPADTAWVGSPAQPTKAAITGPLELKPALATA